MIKRIERADGVRYQVYGRRDGRKVYLATYDSKRAALEADEDHRTTQRKIERGELPPAVDAKRTFGASVKAWLKNLEDAGSRSWSEYSSRVNLYMLPTFEHVPLVDIRKVDVIAWRDRLGQQVAGATVNTVLATMSSAFTFFVDSDWVAQNPCLRVKHAQHVAKVFPWIQSTDAVTRLLGECYTNIQSLVAVLVGTGMRLDEALLLRWDDIDLEHRLIHVHRGRKGTTKSGRGRHVPIFDSVLVVLRELKIARGGNVYLWPGRFPSKPRGPAAIRVPFKLAAKRAGLPPELRVHDLRHSFASLFLIDGGDIFKLSRILGHSSVAITERTYAHLKPTAFEADYGRVSFRIPAPGKVLRFAQG